MLALAAVLLAAGLTMLAVGPVLPVYLAGWALLGLGMGCSLYDPAFATLGRLYGANARPAITSLTLWGGFDSTVCWPLSALLVAHVGWRGACLAYVGLHLTVTLPLVLFLIPPVAALADVADICQGEPGGEIQVCLGFTLVPSHRFGVLHVHLPTGEPKRHLDVWSRHLVERV